jgi:hypothetical protein
MPGEPILPIEDMALCHDVDVQSFKSTCRVPLFPGQWNSWQLWVNDERASSWEAVEDLIHDALRVWFEYGIVAPFNSIPIHDVRLSREPYANVDGTPVQRAVRKEDCLPWPANEHAAPHVQGESVGGLLLVSYCG